MIYLLRKISPLFFILLFVVLTQFNAFAQKPGQVYITSYDNDRQPVFFCDGVLQNQVQITYGVANLLYQTDPIVYIDSIVYICDHSVFQYTETVEADDLGILSINPGPVYVPSKIGVDTLTIKAFYGPYTSIGTIICHAVASPSIAFFGYTQTILDFGGGNRYYNLNQQLKADTLHDPMNGRFPFIESKMPVRPGVNEAIEIRSCGGSIIDSIYLVGDFSEFEFTPFPTLPYTVSEHESLQFTYLFTPSVVGKTPHYLVIHTTAGKYLVWSFEYEVRANGDVDITVSEDAGVLLYPNPAVDHLKIKMPATTDKNPMISIVNPLGVMVLFESSAIHNYEADGSDMVFDFDVSHLPSGNYTLIYNSSLRKIARQFIVFH